MHPDVVRAQLSQLGLFTTAQARAAGYTGNEIASLTRAGRWVRVRRGVFTTRELDEGADFRSRLRQAALADCLCIGAAATASHGSAAVEHDFWWLRPIETVRPAITLPPRSLSVTATSHVYRATLSDAERWSRGPLWVTTPARTVVDLGRHLPFEEAIVIADSALQRSQVDPHQLLRVLERCEGWPGWRRAEAVLTLADGRSQSPYETLARVRSMQHDLPTPEPQVKLPGADGRLYEVDLYWKRERTIGEIDGKIKYVDGPGNDPDEVRWRERIRDSMLRETGHELVRMTPGQVEHEFPSVKARLLAAFARSWNRAS